MKKWLAATLLVAMIAATGCSDSKKTTKPTTPSTGTSAPANGTTPPAGEKK